MIKVSAPVNQNLVLEIESFLFESAPSPWSIVLNRKSKVLFLEGIFKNKQDYQEKIQHLHESLSKSLDQIKIEKLDESWKEAYKNHFKTWSYKGINFIPEWERVKNANDIGDSCVYIDPGMAFGTGNHETTRLCIELLTDLYYQQAIPKNSFLDVGCGSGILSIFAQVLGFRSIAGIDNDECAIANSKINASINFKSPKINFSKKNISSIDSNLYNCVVANIQSDVLMTYCNKFTRALQKKGNLVLSGILDYEVEVVCQTFQKQLRTDHLNAKIYTRRKREWCALHIKLL